MNKQGKGGIEWCDFTWNPVVGCTCRCSYCYARRLAKRFKGRCQQCYEFTPHLHPERLGEPLRRKKPARIFVCDMGDLFDKNVPMEWIDRVYRTMNHSPQHTFQLLTKQPHRANTRFWPHNVWLGVSVENQGADFRVRTLRHSAARVKFVSFEPLLGRVHIDLNGIDWIIIGAQTRPEIQPRVEWVQWLIAEARRVGAAVFLKNNLDWWGPGERYREFPK